MSSVISEVNRRIVKARKVAEIGHCQWPGCDLPIADLHEIVSRGQTEQNPEARQLSFVPELTAALCHLHHIAAHENAEASSILLAENARLYGKERVQGALDALKAASRSHLDIELPEEL